MAADLVAAADWRDPQAFEALVAGDRACFAWEWLRRSPSYVEAWATGGLPAAFGLLRFEDPTLGAIAARPFWHADANRAVLRAEMFAPGEAALRGLARLAHLVTRIAPASDNACEHILLSDGLRSIRIDLMARGSAGVPGKLRWHIDGVLEAGPQLLALRQLMALARTGCFARSLHPPERRARRWIDMLRVHDAIAGGATYREIARELFSIDVTGSGWRLAAGSWRLRVQRLAAAARRCIAMGPIGWLGGPGDR